MLHRRFNGGSAGGGGAGGPHNTSGEVNAGGAATYGGGGGGVGGGTGNLHIQSGNHGFGGGQHGHDGFGGGGFGSGAGGGNIPNRDGSAGFGAGGDILVMQGATLTISSGTLGEGSVAAGQLAMALRARPTARASSCRAARASRLARPRPPRSAVTSPTRAARIRPTSTTSRAPARSSSRGDGTVALSGNNSFTGGIKITGDILDLESVYAAGSGAILFEASGDPTLEFTVVRRADQRDRRFCHRRQHPDRWFHRAVGHLFQQHAGASWHR